MKKYILLSLIFSISLHAAINLIWQGDRINMWEESWIMELLNGINFNVIDDGNYEVMLDNSIIIGHDGRKMDAYARKLHAKGYKFGVIHTSDEMCRENTDFYSFAEFVFRNIWHPKFSTHTNVFIFPLGYKNKFWSDGYQEIEPAKNRKYTWSFAGRIEAHRRPMIQGMKKIPNNFVHQIHQWNDNNSLLTHEYRNLLLNTIFIPCPGGAYTPDNFRLYETLECGCIPIVEQKQEHYFRNLLGDIPFIVINNWAQASPVIDDFLNHPSKLEKKQTECYEWWLHLKAKFNSKFVNIIEQKLLN